LDNRYGIHIGNNVSIGHNTKIYTGGHDLDSPSFSMTGKPVVIDDYVAILSNVLIMPGVHIKKGAVILPGAVVTKDIAEYGIAGGNPAKVLRFRSKNLEYVTDYNFHKAL
jgi:maltose O-acetyltransferase